MKTKFLYCRTYIFEETDGKRQHWSFKLVDRFGKTASFKPNDKDCKDVISAPLEFAGQVETVRFLHCGKEYTLRADLFQSKDYPLTTQGLQEKNNDTLRDAHSHTIDNLEEIEQSSTVYCICCGTYMHPEEIDDYTDGGRTAICSYCGTDALIGNASGIDLKNEFLKKLRKKYF